MQISPHLVFPGNSEAVLQHYRDALGGDLEIMRFAGSPAEEQMPAGWGEKVLYGTLRSPFGLVHCMDASPERAGTPGDNFVLGVDTDSEAQTDEIFAKLLAGGSVVMPLQKTFWSPKFGMLTDRFGIKWMVNFQGA